MEDKQITLSRNRNLWDCLQICVYCACWHCQRLLHIAGNCLAGWGWTCEVSERWKQASFGVKFPLWPLPPTKCHTHLEVEKRDCLPASGYFNTDDSRCKCLWLDLQLPIYSMTTVRPTDRGETWCKHTCLPFIFQQLHSSNKEPSPPAANHLAATLPPPLGHLCRDCNTQVFCWTHKRVSSWMDGLDTHGASWSKQRDRAERAGANTGRMLKACFPISLHVGMTCSPLSRPILD